MINFGIEIQQVPHSEYVHDRVFVVWPHEFEPVSAQPGLGVGWAKVELLLSLVLY